MALKSYHRETLNDNWYEERAAPLNGVLPHDGLKEYSTTTRADFAGAQPLVPRLKPRMISDENVDAAMRQTAAIDWSRGFRGVLPRPDPEPERHLVSTHRRVFVNHMPSTRASVVSPASAAGAKLAAGGAGGRNVERGKAASGAMGEVYKVSHEPQKDTLAQRSWMYSTDPMVVAMHKRAAQPQEAVTAAREPQQPGSKATAGFGRTITSITGIRGRHTGVFVDDEDQRG